MRRIEIWMVPPRACDHVECVGLNPHNARYRWRVSGTDAVGRLLCSRRLRAVVERACDGSTEGA